VDFSLFNLKNFLSIFVAVGIPVARYPPHRSVRLVLPVYGSYLEFLALDNTLHDEHVLSGALRPGRNYAPTRHSVRTAATCPGVPLSHVLPSTDSAEVDMSSCSPASSVLRCVRLPRSFMSWTYGITPSPAHPPFVLCFSCSSFPSEQSHLRRNRRFFLLDSPIPALNEGGFPGLPIPAQEVSTHAKVLRLRQVLPQLACNAAVDIAFPISQQGRHPKEVISELNAPPALSPTHASAIVLPQPPCGSGPV
jgi:hypothetical protein